MRLLLTGFTLLLLREPESWSAENDALAISRNIQARHMPFGTLLDPIYASSTSEQLRTHAVEIPPFGPAHTWRPNSSGTT